MRTNRGIVFDECRVWDIRRRWIQNPRCTLVQLAHWYRVPKHVVVYILRNSRSRCPAWFRPVLAATLRPDDPSIMGAEVREYLQTVLASGRGRFRTGELVSRATGRTPLLVEQNPQRPRIPVRRRVW